MVPHYYNTLNGHPLLAAIATALVGACAWIWLMAERRALRGADRIRKKKLLFQSCEVIEVERFLAVVKSARLVMSDGEVLRFRPMDKTDALMMSNLSPSDRVSLARDTESDAAILQTKAGEAIGSFTKEQ